MRSFVLFPSPFTPVQKRAIELACDRYKIVFIVTWSMSEWRLTCSSERRTIFNNKIFSQSEGQSKEMTLPFLYFIKPLFQNVSKAVICRTLRLIS